MPSSTTSAPAFGSALRIASEVFGSGSPAVKNVTSPARPSRLRSSNRVSMRVAIFNIASWSLLANRTAVVADVTERQELLIAFAHLGHADVDGAEHDADEREAEENPLLALYRQACREQPGLKEIEEPHRGRGN